MFATGFHRCTISTSAAAHSSIEAAAFLREFSDFLKATDWKSNNEKNRDESEDEEFVPPPQSPTSSERPSSGKKSEPESEKSDDSKNIVLSSDVEQQVKFLTEI